MPLTCDSGPEAKEWLTIQAAAHGFAPNRFTIKDEAISFVEGFYDAGAAKVFIPSDDIRDYPKLRSEVGGATANSMVITLPPDEEKRRVVVAAYLAEATAEGYDAMTEEEAVIDEKYLYLWWD